MRSFCRGCVGKQRIATEKIYEKEKISCKLVECNP